MIHLNLIQTHVKRQSSNYSNMAVDADIWLFQSSAFSLKEPGMVERELRKENKHYIFFTLGSLKFYILACTNVLL